MSVSETMNLNVTAVPAFEFCPLRFRFIARQPVRLAAGGTANLLRGQFGKLLHRDAPAEYARVFAPTAEQGPSGLRDLPRPFVFRVAHLEGARIAPGETFEIGMNLFDVRQPLIDVLREALAVIARERLGGAELAGVEGAEPMKLRFDPAAAPQSCVRVKFVTPTELKGTQRPEFGVLLARIRDRVSTLRALYGAGPLEIDFKALGERARAVRMTRCDLRTVEAERLSRRTGQSHPLGGFTGLAEYEGKLAEFVPYLEAARWTGVGRQTVWGKGEIAWEAV
jgi:hypothetical protein